ncbi:flagellar hook-basal body protein [Candidatus Poribacteria bacterium]|nr:flagellar hook-basal body protein [Candidatus Poribacteria bacterium]
MLQGIYTAASGMLAHDAISEVITNNLANASTPGFRQDFATFHTAADAPHPQDSRYLAPVLTFKAYTNFDIGSLKPTGNPLDLAFNDGGENFFVVQTPQGIRYTRAGNFTLNGSNTIVNAQNYPVLGENGPIQANGSKIEIGAAGDVVVDGVLVDRLRVIQFDPINGRTPLQKDGYTLFRPIGNSATPRNASNPRVQQGALEGSNVSLVNEMAQMIHITRGFEAYQRAIQVSDATLNTLIHRVGGAG